MNGRCATSLFYPAESFRGRPRRRSIAELIEKYGLTVNDLASYLPPDYKELERARSRCNYLAIISNGRPRMLLLRDSSIRVLRPIPCGRRDLSNTIVSTTKIDGFHYYTTYSSLESAGRLTTPPRKSGTIT